MKQLNEHILYNLTGRMQHEFYNGIRFGFVSRTVRQAAREILFNNSSDYLELIFNPAAKRTLRILVGGPWMRLC
jgi:hypothetical protein